MRVTRVHVPGPLEPDSACAVHGETAHHIVRVLRLGVGARVDVFDGQGAEYVGRIETVRKGEVMLALGERRDGGAESPLRLTLAQGVSRGERMDWVVQKAVELGAAHIVPVLTERSVVRLDAGQARNKQCHWQRIAVAACEQSGRTRVPQVAVPVALAALLDALPEGDLRVLPSPEGAAGLAALPAAAAGVLVLIGPEGGLAEAERRAALARGFQPVRFGPRVLRTETAAVVALTLLQQRFGDL
ncbi:MAG: 16S rRNA (uracil(1498)-N(3))-methyltransferase [Steroidobacteraceae bacterium]